MNKMSLIAVAMIALTNTLASASEIPGCNFEAPAQLVTRVGEGQFVDRFVGHKDKLRNTNCDQWNGSSGIPVPAAGSMYDFVLRQRNDPAWYESERTAVVAQCEAYIQQNHLNPVQYSCGSPTIRFTEGAHCKAAVAVQLLRYSIQTWTLTDEEILTYKCQKLDSCLSNTSNAGQIEAIHQTQSQLGCRF